MATRNSPGKADPNSDLNYMKGVTAFFYEAGIGKKRVAILCKQLKKFGGLVSDVCDDQVTHIIMSKTKTIDKLLQFLKIKSLGESVKIVDADWLSACFLNCNLCSVTPYFIQEKGSMQSSSSRKDPEVLGNKDTATEDQCVGQLDKPQSDASPAKRHSLVKAGRKRKQSESDEDTDYDSSSYEESEKDNYSAASSVEMQKPISKPKGVWACTVPSSSRSENLNEHITEKLEVLAKAYLSTQDRWRAFGYQKAISTIKKYPKKIETAEELKNLPFIGERLAKKIAEILETGHLRRLDHLDPNLDIINKFNAVWGAGPKTAETWLAQGHRNLEDLRTKADLTFQQKIGLKFYDEFLEKIDRKEVEEIENFVKETACELIAGMEVITCGSYRRGRQLCGDVDILISHPDGRSHKGFLLKLIEALQKKGLITNDLITVDNEEQRKYMGVFKLPGDNRKHRRLDIIIAPYSEMACALVHFTGSGRLNRSMRQLAKTKGMSLSEHALRTGVIRQGQEKIYKGSVIPVSREEDIFRHLGLDYLQPHDRDL